MGIIDGGVIGKLLCVCFFLNWWGTVLLFGGSLSTDRGACLVIITLRYTISFKTPSTIATSCCKPLVKCSRRATPRLLVRRYLNLLFIIFKTRWFSSGRMSVFPKSHEPRTNYKRDNFIVIM